jgi:TetR/AcrR family transcriptional repressor of nem operon
MAKPNPAAREALLEAAQQLMLAQGFVATTVDQICQAAAVTKGAFFHYFKSKDELAKATFDRFCRRGGERYQRAPFLKKNDPLERLNGYVDFTIAQVKHPLRDSCLVGMFSQELADSHPMFRTMCDDAFTQWSAGLKTMLDEVKQRYAPKASIDTRSLADHFLAVFEGSLILAKAKNDVAPVKAQLRHFKRYVNALFKEARR